MAKIVEAVFIFSWFTGADDGFLSLLAREALFAVCEDCEWIVEAEGDGGTDCRRVGEKDVELHQ